MYFDTSYLVRLYLDDPGFESVRELAATASISCCSLGSAEMVAAFHRKYREGSLSSAAFKIVLAEFRKDDEAGAFTWLAFSPAVLDEVKSVYGRLGPTIFLRAADAIHLACAKLNGFKEVYSNDAKLLSAASAFGLVGINVVP